MIRHAFSVCVLAIALAVVSAQPRVALHPTKAQGSYLSIAKESLRANGYSVVSGDSDADAWMYGSLGRFVRRLPKVLSRPPANEPHSWQL